MTTEVWLTFTINGCIAQSRDIDGAYRGASVVLARGSRQKCEEAILEEMRSNPEAIRVHDRLESGRYSGPEPGDAGGLAGFGALD